MATTVVRDYVIWTKHIAGDPQLVDEILRMPAGETITLLVDDIRGTWSKMANGPGGEQTPGLRPLDRMKQVWGSYFRDRRNAVVEVRKTDEGSAKADRPQVTIEPPLARNEEERRAAWQAFLDLAKLGWRSEGPYGPRDELYDE